VEVHLLGGPSDRAPLENLRQLLRAALPQLEVVNHAGTASLGDSVAVLSRSHLAFCIDSALLHFSRLLGVPTISYWGPSEPRILMRPSPYIQDEVHYVKLPCSPCVHMSDRVPCGGDNICMRLAVNPDAPVDRNPLWLVQ
jgi:ADP-heptose:LPS heptosyltransferase